MYILEDNREIIDYPFDKCDEYDFEYIFAFNNKRKRDISNHIKLFEDIIFRLFIKDDDSKVKSIRINSFIFKNSKNLNYLFVRWTCKQEEYKPDDEKLIRFLSNIR